MITILDYINNNLHLKLERKGSHLFALSPFTEEKTASFCVFEQTNSYYDYSSSFGGDVVDLHKRLNNLDRKTAYKELINDTLTVNSFMKFNVIKPNIKKEVKKPTFEIISITDINDQKLIDYIKNRGIGPEILKANCKELKYKIKDQYTFKAICFKNDHGGIEIRNEKFKGGFGDKTITTIKAKNKCNTLDIFEGFLDFLSYLSVKNILLPENNVIVLNSLSMLKRVIPGKEIKKIRLFLDNDVAGNKGITYFKETFSFLNIEDQRIHYKDFNDFNDWLINRIKNK